MEPPFRTDQQQAGVLAGDAAPTAPDAAVDSEQPPSVSDLEPGTLPWRITIATLAFRFFSLIHNKEVAETINRPADAGKADAWPVAYFTLYLQKLGVPGGSFQAMARIFSAMESFGLLMRAGWWAPMNGSPWQGQLYITQGIRSEQFKGYLWLSEVLGPELVIEAYKGATMQITGAEGKRTGTALILDQTHVVTNRHVIEGIVGHEIIDSEFELHPSFKPEGLEWVSRKARIKTHPDIDVAVIEVEADEGGGFRSLPGLVFRDPRPADDIRVLGYPEVLGLTEQPLAVEHGNVVSARPITVEQGDIVVTDAETPAVGGFPRHKVFLTSAIERPGNSGGPIVAQDGRVIGLVIDHTRAGLSQAGGGPGEHNPESPPFYRGIPGSEVVRAVEEMGFEGVAILEDG